MLYVPIFDETQGALHAVVDRYLQTLEAAGQEPPPDGRLEAIVINSLIVSLAESYAEEEAS